MTKKSKSYAKHDNRPGFVPEQDHHFTVNYLPIIEGFTAHAEKRRPDLRADQWVEVIHRNGERSRGPVETFAWDIYKCHPNDREDYYQFKHLRIGSRKNAFDFIDLEVTHFRTTETPSAEWLQGDPWPFEELERAA